MTEKYTISDRTTVYLVGKKICEVETITLPPSEPLHCGVDLGGVDATTIRFTGKITVAFVNPDFLHFLVNDLTEKVQEIAGVTEQEARQYVLNMLGLDDLDLVFGRGVPFTHGLLTGNELKSVIVDEFGVPATKTSEPSIEPLKNVRSTKDATPWTHKREPWRAHRPKRGKR